MEKRSILEYVKGKNIIDINANYETEDVANVRRQISAYAEYTFNRELIKDEIPHGTDALEHHKEEIYLHDMSKLLILPYCYSYSLLNIFNNGIKYYPDFPSNPPKRLDSFISLVVEFSSYAANRTRGAIAFPDLIPFLAYYQKNEDLSAYTFVNQCQRLFYSWNQHLRQGAESLFTNISFFDRYYIESLFGDTLLPILDITVDDVIRTQKEVMLYHTDEILHRNMLRFPVITCALSRDNGNIADKDLYKFATEQNVHHNMYNFLILENLKAIASCCRLINDGENPFLNSYGSGSVDIGSSQVVSLNLPGIVIRHPDDYEEKIYNFLDLSIDFLIGHRNVLEKYSHLDKLWNQNFRTFNRLLSTVGIMGLWDFKMLTDLSWDETKNIMTNLQNHIKKRANFINLELVPAETASVALCQKDSKVAKGSRFSTHYSNVKLYSNQVVAPWDDISFPERVKIASMFSNIFDGGQMFFVSVDSGFTNNEQMMTIMDGLAKNNIPYFCFDTFISRCKSGHTTTGSRSTCPICGTPDITQFRRVVGYFVQLTQMHDRKDIDIPNRRSIE